MRRQLAQLFLGSLIVLAALPAAADTTSSGRVLNDASQGGGPVTAGWVALITRSTLDLFPPEQQVWFDQIASLDGSGNFAFMIDDANPAYDEFYLYTISQAHLNEIHGGVVSTFTLPLQSDFDRAGVTPLSGDFDNLGITFSLGTNRSTHRVLMRDGETELATDVYMASPTREAPTILLRTPYNKDTAGYVAYYTIWGYNVVCQDSRGRFASDGVDAVFRADGWGQHQDGYDTIDWIVNQSWGNENVGMHGGSAVAITQYLCAGAGRPALKCCYAIVGSGAHYPDMFFVGGVFRKHMIEGWLEGQGSSYFMKEVEAHPNQDDWWAEVDIESRVPEITVPFVHVVGWFDIFTEGGVRAFTQLQYDAAEGARGNQKMVIGPWTHGGIYQRQQGEMTFPENATDRGGNFDNELQFFDYWLKGIDNGFYDTPPVRYYVMGDVTNSNAPGNEWRFADDWPVPATRRSYWFTRTGGLTKTGGGSFASNFSSAGSVAYQFDPNNPAPTRGGNNLALPAGPHDQRPVEDRPDVIEFTTPVLTEPLEVTGNVRAQLLISCDQPDTDFMVKLCDVYPDGRSMLIAEGAIHARHRLGHDSENLLIPGRLYRLDVDLWSTSIVFNAGHRIRVSVTSSNSPRWEVNPNTGEPFRQHTEMRTATNRVFCIPGIGSCIVLPVVE